MKLKVEEINNLLKKAYQLGQDGLELPIFSKSNKEEWPGECGTTTIKVEASVEIQSKPRTFVDECAEHYAAKDLEWFMDEINVLTCFYNLSKAEMEKYAAILIPYIVEEYGEIFEVEINLNDVVKILSDIPFYKVNKCNYRSTPIMLYRCFNFITWEKKSNKKEVIIFYNDIPRAKGEELRKKGYHLAEAIQDYTVKK